MNTYISNDLSAINAAYPSVANGGAPYGRIYAGSALAIGNGSQTKIALASTDVLGHGMLLTTNGIQVPIAGMYGAVGQLAVNVATNSMSDFVPALYNGTNQLTGLDDNGATYGVGSYRCKIVMVVATCAASDILYLYGRADSTTNQTTLTGAGANYLHVWYIGAA